MIMLNNSPVERVHSFKLLGVLLTTSLSWSEHITAVQCALKLANGCISLICYTIMETVIRPVAVTDRVCMCIEASQQNNWRRYSGVQLGLYLVRNWILTWSHYLQTDVTDKYRTVV